VWDNNGLTPEDQRLDEECRRRARLVAAGGTLEEANLPPLVRGPIRQVAMLVRRCQGQRPNCCSVGVSCCTCAAKSRVRFYGTGL